MAVDFALWLRTYRNQRLVAHYACIFLGLALLVAGMVGFISSGMAAGPGDDSQYRVMTAWASTGAGAFGAWGSFYLLKTIQTVERDDVTVTEEQASVTRTAVTIIGGIFQVLMVIASILISVAGVKYQFVALSTISILYILTLIATLLYDVIEIVLPGRILLGGYQGGGFADEFGVLD